MADEIYTLFEMIKEKLKMPSQLSGKKILEIWKLVDEEIEKTKTGIIEINEFMHEQSETFTSKRIKSQRELRRLDRMLDFKAELYEDFNRKSRLDLEQKLYEEIKNLKAKKNYLTEKLKQVNENESAIINEERRRQLKVLEQEIKDYEDMNQQNIRRGNEKVRLENLHREIQAIKESKVKLVCSMRQESENLRKLMDRKFQNEITVLERKVEEASAIFKRLEYALEKQKVVQSMRQKQQSNRATISELLKTPSAEDPTIKNEHMVSVIGTAVFALYFILINADKKALVQLMTDRGIISNRVAELLPETNTPAAAELENLEEDLEMRNAQIADLNGNVDTDPGKRSSKRVTPEDTGTKPKKGCSCRFDCKYKQCGCRSKLRRCSSSCSCSNNCCNKN